MLKKTILLCVVICIITTSTVWGVQETPQFKQGDRTLTLGGSGNSNKEFESTVLSVNVGFSYFVRDQIAAALRQEINFADPGNNQVWNGSTRVAADYHWDLNTVKPFLGANIGYLYGDNVKEQFIAGPETGIKVFLSANTFVFVNAEYQILFKNADQINNQFDDGRFVYALGLGFRW